MAERAALTDSLTPRNVQPLGLTGFGDPIFSDEFNRVSWDNGKWLPWYPDTEFWNTTQPGGHKTNSFEPQGYDETGLSMLSGGGIRFNFHESNHAVPELDYTSGMLCSYGALDVQYGVFEARMKLTNTQGSWPAFWMVQSNQVWPPEIDWMEAWGRPSFNTTTHHTYHYPRVAGAPTGYTSSTAQASPDLGSAYHTFTGVWEPGRLRWYVDGKLAKELESAYLPDSPMYLILNLAGDKDDPNAGANAPFHIDVKYVRAWSLDGVEVDPGNEEPPVEEPEPTLFLNSAGLPLTVQTLRNGELVPVTLNR